MVLGRVVLKGGCGARGVEDVQIKFTRKKLQSTQRGKEFSGKEKSWEKRKYNCKSTKSANISK